jgi:hypothetical protein
MTGGRSAQQILEYSLTYPFLHIGNRYWMMLLGSPAALLHQVLLLVGVQERLLASRACSGAIAEVPLHPSEVDARGTRNDAVGKVVITEEPHLVL